MQFNENIVIENKELPKRKSRLPVIAFILSFFPTILLLLVFLLAFIWTPYVLFFLLLAGYWGLPFVLAGGITAITALCKGKNQIGVAGITLSIISLTWSSICIVPFGFILYRAMQGFA